MSDSLFDASNYPNKNQTSYCPKIFWTNEGEQRQDASLSVFIFAGYHFGRLHPQFLNCCNDSSAVLAMDPLPALAAKIHNRERFLPSEGSFSSRSGKAPLPEGLLYQKGIEAQREDLKYAMRHSKVDDDDDDVDSLRLDLSEDQELGNKLDTTDELTLSKDSNSNGSSNKNSHKKVVDDLNSVASSADDFEDDNESMLEESKEQARFYRGLAPEETKVVKRLRMLMIIALFSVAIAISVSVGWYLGREEKDEFEDEFAVAAAKLVGGFQDDSFQKMQALDSLSSSLTNYAVASNATWPFVQLHDSHSFLTPYLSLANAASIRIQPLVKPRERIQWEKHTRDNADWVERDLEAIQEQEGEENSGRRLQYFGQNQDEENARVSPYIKNYVGVDTSPEQFLPWWQYAPVIPNRWFLNFNMLSDGQFIRDTKSVLGLGKSVISKTESFVPGLDFQSTKDFDFLQQLLEAGGYGQYQPGEPISFIHYPVFDQPEGADGASRKVVAILTATVYWRTYFENILSSSAKGVICVVENDKQVFTYRIDGGAATFVGLEDMHEVGYDEYRVSAEYRAFEEGSDSQRYSGASVDSETQSGAYRISVYPSKDLEEEYTSAEPWIYAAGIMALMLVAIFIFLAYDWYVERRQNKVQGVAEKSDAIITSLFPEKVRNQLMERQEQEAAELEQKLNPSGKAKNPLRPQLSSRRLGNFSSSVPLETLNEDGDNIHKSPMAMSAEEQELNPHGTTAPIADFFPSCTVIFMDLAGFTSWSSTRDPAQVFTLLETLYSAFDQIAQKRSVFKVETIGDCKLLELLFPFVSVKIVPIHLTLSSIQILRLCCCLRFAREE